MEGWEFFTCCHVDEETIWTGWRWRYKGRGLPRESKGVFRTLKACKADAVANGFDPEESLVSHLEGGRAMLPFFGPANLSDEVESGIELAPPAKC